MYISLIFQAVGLFHFLLGDQIHPVPTNARTMGDALWSLNRIISFLEPLKVLVFLLILVELVLAHLINVKIATKLWVVNEKTKYRKRIF